MTLDLDLPNLLVIIVMILHRELSVEELAMTTGLGVMQIQQTIQYFLDLNLIEFTHLKRSLPNFRITDIIACIQYLESNSSYTVTGSLSSVALH